MIKINKFLGYLIVSIFCLSLTGGSLLSAATPARQLAKGISLYEDEKNEEAMEYFIDVLVNGNRDEVTEATKYIHLIHDRIGGVQQPVVVDINFKEGEVKSLNLSTDPAVLAAQQQALADAEGKTVLVIDKNLIKCVEAARLAALQKEAAAKAALSADDVLAQDASEAEKAALLAQAYQELSSADARRQEGVLTTDSSSAFTDLTTPEAMKARELYTQQKIESMTAAAIEKINAVKGAYLYMRDGRPDALDIEPSVLFENSKFKASAQPLLNGIYELLALTQGSAYVILPPGSYTDDVTLSGVRQAMALNSYLLNRGISQGKLHYNMGLADQEPPARYANLNGISVVFNYDTKLPVNLEKNESNDKSPLLSMAVVPLCHLLDRSMGEAFVIDFSVLETLNPLDNWVLHVVQHGRDGKYYIVRQLEGFAPVYHQFLWNGRKGIIGPELPCGKYTLVLTATDVKGEKQTLRRRLVVKCSEQTGSCKTGTCAADEQCPTCNYKTARLWKKPARKMISGTKAAAAASDEIVDTVVTTTTVTTVVEEEPASSAQPAAQGGYPYQTQNPEPLPMDNPYDMPYDSYQN